MALRFSPWSVTKASLGYRRSTLLVKGTTWTRFRNWLDASLLTMTAGRCFWISPPTDGSKLTHQTSPRFIRHVPEGDFRPLVSLRLAGFVRCHFPVGGCQILRSDVGTDQGLDELADLLPPDHAVETVIDLLVNGDGELLVHGRLLRIYTYVRDLPPTESRRTHCLASSLLASSLCRRRTDRSGCAGPPGADEELTDLELVCGTLCPLRLLELIGPER